MANHYSALKRDRQTRRRTVANRQHMTRLRHQIRALRRALQSQDKGGIQPVFSKTVSLIDRAARKGVIKKNTAARYKSRLSVRLKALLAAPAA
jgi:small subunit ribosomal protein S20